MLARRLSQSLVARRWTPTLFLATIIALASASLVGIYDVSLISDDGAQFVSVAKNILAGNGFSTSIVYYDQHHSVGRIPAPQTSLPPGYSVFIAAVAVLGVSPYFAAFLVSMICFDLTVILMYRTARLSGLKLPLCIVISALWAFVGISWFNILSCLSEMSHIALILGSLACFLRAERSTRRFGLWCALSGLLAGMAFTIRYLGTFYIVSVGVFLLGRFVRRRDRRSFVELVLGAGIPLVFVAVLFYRNYLVTSSLHGVHISEIERTSADVVRYFYWALSEIVGFSWVGLRELQVAELVLIVFLPASAVFVLINRSSFSVDLAALKKAVTRRVSIFSLIYVAVTVGFFAYWTWRTRAGAVNSRYLIPAIPFSLLLGGLIVASIRVRAPVKGLALWGAAAFAVFLVGQSNSFIRQWRVVVENNQYDTIRHALDQGVETKTLITFLNERVGSENPLLANSPQQLAAVVDRPVLGLTLAPFSDRVWTAEQVHSVVDSYRVTYVLFFPSLFNPDDPMNSNQPFFYELRMRQAPRWLKPVFESSDVWVYQVQSRANHGLIGGVSESLSNQLMNQYRQR